MKKHWLMIVSGVVLAVAVICFVGYQMFKSDSVAKRQIVYQEQKQNVDRSIIDKIPFSKTSGSAPVERTLDPVLSLHSSGNRWATNNKHRSPVNTDLRWKSWDRAGVRAVASAPEVLEWMSQQGQTKPRWNREMVYGPTSGQDSELSSLRQSQVAGNFPPTAGNTMYSSRNGAGVRIIRMSVVGFRPAG